MKRFMSSITVASDIKMNVAYWLLTFGLVAVSYGIPMPQSSGGKLVPGVFIPADAFQNLQNRANANSQQPASSGYSQPTQYQPNTNQPAANQVYQPNTNQVYQPNTNQPTYQPAANPQTVPVTNQVYQPNTNIQPQPTVTGQVYQPTTNVQPQTYQPVVSNQPQYQYQQPGQTVVSQPVMTVQPQPNNQPILNQVQPLMAERVRDQNLNTQPGQQVIYVQQQPASNQPTYVVSQPTQQQQPVVPNPQPSQVVFANQPNGNKAHSNPGTVYTLIPLNTQPANSNSASYLVPIQNGSS